MKRLSTIGIAATAIFAAATVTNANAAASATYTAACSTTGANGSLTFTNPTALYTPINGWVNDNAADGHHVAIRFISNDTNTTKYWPWHHEYNGKGSSLVVTTSATDSSGGLNYLGVQVATMEGSSVLHICTDWVGSGSPPA
jgi:hypothetical protein